MPRSRSQSAWDTAAQQAMERTKVVPITSPKLAQSLAEATLSDPDQEAKTRKLSVRADMPPALVEEDPKAAERVAQLLEINQARLAEESPATARSLEDKVFAGIAHDDIENLSAIERFAGDLFQRFDIGERTRELGKLGFLTFSGRSTPEDERRIQRLQAKSARDVEFGLPTEGIGGFLLGIPGAVAETLPQLAESAVSALEGGIVGGAAAAAVAAIATAPAGGVGAVPGFIAGFPVGATLGLFTASFQAEAGNFFLEARDLTAEDGTPIDADVLRALTFGVGTLAGAVEMFGASRLLKHIPGVDKLTGVAIRASAKQALQNASFRRVVTGIFKAGAFGAVTEGATEATQEGISMTALIEAMEAVGQTEEDLKFDFVDPETGELTTLHGNEAFWARILSAGRQGAQAGLGLGAGGRATRFVTDSERARNAINRVPGVERLRRAGADSKLRERSPEEFKKHARAVAEEANTENVYVDPETMRSFFQDLTEEEAAEVFAAVPSLEAQDEVVSQTNADFVVPFEDWLAHMSPTSAGDALSQGIRFDPLEMTPAEAVAFEAQTVEAFGDIQEIAIEARDEGALLSDTADRLRADIGKVFPPAVAEQFVQISMERIQVRAERLGIPVSQLLQEEGLFRVEGPDETLAPRGTGLSQRLERESVLRVLGDLRAEREPEVTGLSQRPILETLRDLGGVDPESELGRELKAQGIPRRGRGSMARLFPREGGLTQADQLVAAETEIFRELADEAGRVDQNLLMGALTEEVAGRAFLRTEEETAVILAGQEERAAVEQALEAEGLTLESDEAAILEALAPEDRKKFLEMDEDKVRGEVTLDPELQDVVMRFTDSSNLSTFLHESGHLWLAQLNKDAKRMGPDSQLGRDLQTVMQWLGIETEAELFTTEVQENWARSMEAYFFEGKAPTLELQPVFQRFTSWLVRIYKRLSAIPGYQGQLIPEIREVMDRLIASDAAITQTVEALGLELIDAETLGMNPEEAQRFDEAALVGRAESLAQMQSSMMKEMRRQTQKEWKSLKAGIREEVEKDVNSRPVFQAQHWLATGEALPGERVPLLEPTKLDRQTMVELYGKDILKILKSRGKNALIGKDGMTPSQLADVFGFPNGNAMVEALSSAGSRLVVIESETEAAMLKQHGKFQTSGDLEAAATEALSNKKEINALLIQARALTKRVGGRVAPQQVLRRTAERIVQDTRFRHLKPHRYRMAAQRSGRDAIEFAAAGQFANAERATNSQVLNIFLESEARKAIDQTNKNLNRLNTIQGPKSMKRITKAGGDFADQINGLLDRFNLRMNQSLKRIDKLRGLAAWITEQEEGGDFPVITEKLRDEAFRTSWKDLPVKEIQDLRDAVDNIAQLARRKNEFLANRERRDRKAVAIDLAAALVKNVRPGRISKDLVRDEKEKARATFRSATSKMDRMEFIIDLLDGDDPNGPWRQNVFNPIARIEVEKVDRTNAMFTELGTLMKGLMKGKEKEYSTKFHSPELDVDLDKTGVLMLAFNFMNEGNLKRLVEGNGFSEASLQKLFDQNMNRADWEFIKAGGKMANAMWPEIVEQGKRLTGVEPKKVVGRTVRTPFGDVEGFYWPIVYDPNKVQWAFKHAQKGLYEGLEFAFQRAITGHGYEKERQNVAGPLLFDISVLPSHLEQVILDLTHRETLMQIEKLMDSSEIEAAFRDSSLGLETYRLFQPWLVSLAQDKIVDSNPMGGLDTYLKTARLNVSSYTLFLRATTLAMQPLGHFNAAGILRTRLPNWKRHMIGGLKQAFPLQQPTRIVEQVRNIKELSGAMRQRIEFIDRELRDIQRRSLAESVSVSGKAETFNRRFINFSGRLIAYMQFYAVDVPVWIGAYNGAIAEFGEDVNAVEFADSMVRLSQGAAGPKDLSAVQRGSEAQKAFLMFFGYPNLVYNQVTSAQRRIRRPTDSADFLASWFFFITGPMFGALMMRQLLTGRDQFPDDDADWLDWMQWLLFENLAEFGGTIAFARQAASVLRVAGGKGRFFSQDTPIDVVAEQVADLLVPQNAQESMFDAIKLYAIYKGMPFGDIFTRLEKKLEE